MNDNNQTTPVDDQFLTAMGLDGLEGEEKQAALNDILTTLNLQIGMRVADILTDEQAQRFEQLSDDSTPEQIAAWLRQNIPNYDQIAEEEAQKLRGDVQATVNRVMKKM